MNRDEFEKVYADKYTEGDVLPVFWNRDFEGYTDHHIDLCWKVQQAKDMPNTSGSLIMLFEMDW